ncbi:hypothetical protein RRF57_006088 [Xylaria bambusicola]|uniref:Carrier domain-containing protein n=1 Tax=Xylaria bambusicola TaxID=326684 RepID=A0AAN7UIT7_9PEZI
MAASGKTDIRNVLRSDGAALKDVLGSFTNVEPSALKPDSSLEDLGLDSIAAVQLANALLLQLQLQVHPDELFKVSLNTLAEYAQKAHPASMKLRSSDRSNANVPSGLATPLLASDSTTLPSSLVQVISQLAKVPFEHISETSKLSELGIDSFSLCEIKQQLERIESKQFVFCDIQLCHTLHDLAAQLTVLPLSPSRSAADGTVEAAAETQECLITRPSLDRSCNPLEILAQSNSIYEAASHRSGFAGYWSTVSPLQQDLLLSYINEAFITLGVNLSEQPQGVETPTIPCIPKHERLVKRLLDILEARYIVRQCRGKVLRGSDCIDVDTSARLCEQLRIQHPSFECEAKLLNLIGPRLAECLSGKVDPLSVLFGSAESRHVMGSFYRDAPMMAAHTEQLISFFVSLVETLAVKSQTPIRVLEVGAGTGGTTAPLVAALRNTRVHLDYTFTDIGASFVHKAKARWEGVEWMSFAVLDIEAELPECFRGQYDIVVGTNVVHATRDRTSTCRRLRYALRPGGVLALSELTRPIDWYDICFGLLDGWWLADEGYAIQPATVWMDAFEKAGFQTMGHSSGDSEEANTQRLLIACTED